jgi:hypothetical protein
MTNLEYMIRKCEEAGYLDIRKELKRVNKNEIGTWLKDKHTDMAASDILESAFEFASTPQGAHFWYEIVFRLRRQERIGW